MTSVRHLGIVVADLDRSLAFYRDLLGFRIEKTADEQGAFLDSILGLRRAEARTVKLRGDGETLIELLLFRNPPSDLSPPPPLTRRGPTHLALTVTQLDALHARLTAAGVECTTAPRVSPDGRVKVTFCRDPDGTWLEMVEILSR